MKRVLLTTNPVIYVVILLVFAGLLAILFTGCGGNPAGPSASPAQTVTLTGRLTAVNGGQGLPGVQATLGATMMTTGVGGAFSASMPPTGASTLSLTGAGIVPRTLQVAMQTSRDLAVDAIALDGVFDLHFYQQLVRDSLESPSLQPLRRWTTSPNLYLQTGTDAATLDMVERVAREAVSQWIGGRLAVGIVERGPDTRQGQTGWLTIKFSDDPRYCGLSDVGLNGGTITLFPRSTTCACDGTPIRPRTVRHEVGHALGFYHVDDPTALMYRVASQCDQTPSSREAYHAAIAYSRQVGNLAPDTDPSGVVSLAPMQVGR